MSKTISMDIKLEKLKVVSSVELISKKSKKAIPYDAFIDTGSSHTAISEKLFKSLGYTEQSKIPVTITGINAKSNGFSTIIDNFIIGDVNIGKTRVTVSKFVPEFENVVIIGMNVLAWFNMLVSHTKGEMTLAERQIKNIDKDTRFNRVDIFTKDILLGELVIEEEE